MYVYSAHSKMGFIYIRDVNAATGSSVRSNENDPCFRRRRLSSTPTFSSCYTHPISDTPLSGALLRTLFPEVELCSRSQELSSHWTYISSTLREDLDLFWATGEEIWWFFFFFSLIIFSSMINTRSPNRSSCSPFPGRWRDCSLE